MEKPVQAVEIAAMPATGRGKPAGTAENGEDVPFSAVLAPAREDMAEAAGDGNALPGEQELPAKAAVTQAAAEEAEATDPAGTLLAMASGSPADEARVPLAGASRATDEPAARPATGEAAVTREPVARQGEHGITVQGQLASGRVAPAALPEAAVPESETPVSGKSVGAVNTAPAQAAGPDAGKMVNEVPLAAVRAGVQQALAAQAARDGLRQSLTGKERNNRLLSTPASTAVDPAMSSFTPLLTEATAAGNTARIGVPVGEPGWARAVGEQVTWHVSQNIRVANLRLNPQHLGPLEMQVQMDGDKATVAFVSQHAVVREALESALPRLREMFTQNGLDIVDVNVSRQDTSGRQAQDDATPGQDTGGLSQPVQTGEQSEAVTPRHVVATGIVDYYV